MTNDQARAMTPTELAARQRAHTEAHTEIARAKAAEKIAHAKSRMSKVCVHCGSDGGPYNVFAASVMGSLCATCYTEVYPIRFPLLARLEAKRVCTVRRDGDNFEFIEACDGCFGADLSLDEVQQLAAELLSIS